MVQSIFHSFIYIEVYQNLRQAKVLFLRKSASICCDFASVHAVHPDFIVYLSVFNECLGANSSTQIAPLQGEVYNRGRSGIALPMLNADVVADGSILVPFLSLLGYSAMRIRGIYCPRYAAMASQGRLGPRRMRFPCGLL